MPLTAANSVEAAAQSLCGSKRTIVARRGDQGAFVLTPTESFDVPAFQTPVVDTLGAGDAFDGGFIAARLTKLGTREAAMWGNAVAALKIARAGARALPSLQDLKQMLDSQA